MHVRPARPQEAAALAALPARSKAHWGYPRDVVERIAATSTLPPEVVADGDVLRLEPDEIGRGSGRLLVEHAAARARAAGATVLEREAEPNAVGFSTRTGGATVRYTDSSLGRRLPVMQLRPT